MILHIHICLLRTRALKAFSAFRYSQSLPVASPTSFPTVSHPHMPPPYSTTRQITDTHGDTNTPHAAMANAYHVTEHPSTSTNLALSSLRPHSDEVQCDTPASLVLFHASTQGANDDTHAGDGIIPTSTLAPDCFIVSWQYSHWQIIWRC